MSDRRTAVHDSLREMADQNQLSPRNVVDQAREETNVLHPLFEWDDNIAADHHRLDQARRLISSFEVIVTRGENRYRVQEFIEDIRKPEDKQGYVRLESIVDDRQAARDFIEREMRLAQNYTQKCVDFANVLGLRQRVETIVEHIDGLRNDIQQQHQPAA